MAFNYVAMHAAIKTAIDLAGFQYIPVHDWGNFSEGVFPEALNDRGYAILINSQEESEYETDQINRNFVSVEFCLETANDAYLATLDNAVAAITTLATITGAGLCDVVSEGLQDFTILYLPKDSGQGKAIVQFPNIKIDIQE